MTDNEPTDPPDYVRMQAAMLAAYRTYHEADYARLQQENQRLRWTVAILFIAGTLQWLLQWL